MNEDIELSEPEGMDTDTPPVVDEAAEQAFVAANAEYFAQALAPLNGIFRNSGMMNIISEELHYTVAVGMRTVGEEGVLDVDCVMLEPNQASLKDCLNALFV